MGALRTTRTVPHAPTPLLQPNYNRAVPAACRCGPSRGARCGPSRGARCGPSRGARCGPSGGARCGRSRGARCGPSRGARCGMGRDHRSLLIWTGGKMQRSRNIHAANHGRHAILAHTSTRHNTRGMARDDTHIAATQEHSVPWMYPTDNPCTTTASGSFDAMGYSIRTDRWRQAHIHKHAHARMHMHVHVCMQA